jgi:Mor family transcriptional regulator
MMTKLTNELWQEFFTIMFCKMLGIKHPVSKTHLAEKYNVTVNTICRWIDKFKLHKYICDGRKGLSSTNKKDRNLKIYEEYWRNGTSLARIGKKYNVSRQRVHVIVKTMEQHRLNGQV